MKLKFIQSSLLVLSFLFVQSANAQNNCTFSFTNATTDCSGASPQFCADLAIQADVATNIGAYTAFFDYNTAAINNSVYTPATPSSYENNACYRAFDIDLDSNDGTVNLTVNTQVIQPTTAEPCSDVSIAPTVLGTFCFDVMDDTQTTGIVFDAGLTRVNQFNNNPDPSQTANMIGTLIDLDTSVACSTANCHALSVSNLAHSFAANGDVTLSWMAIPNAQAYQLAGKKQGGPVKVFPETQLTSRTFPAEALAANTTYLWSIKVKCDGVWTAYALDGPPSGNSPATFTTPPGISQKNNSNFVDAFATTTKLQVNLYPNPTRDNVNVQFEAPMLDFNNNPTLTINVYDLIGRQLLTKKVETSLGQIELNLAGFDKGYYLVEVDNGANKAVEKLAVY